MAELNDVHRLVRYLSLIFFSIYGKKYYVEIRGQTVIYIDICPCLQMYFVCCLFRALLEGERVGLPDAHRRATQHQRERIIGTVLKVFIVVTH